MVAVPLQITEGGKTFRRKGHTFSVFRDLNLMAQQGESLALLGPSGCGKSTLLRIIAGLERLDHGNLELSEPEGHVGIVFQQALLLPWLTVRENIELGLRYRANKSMRNQGHVEDALSEFGLEQLAEAYPDELSGGQAQRVSFARTLVTRPSIVLLDEPFGALDPMTRNLMQDWLVELQRRLRLTVVLVTHDVDEAIRLGDRVLLMTPSPGRIEHEWSIPPTGVREDQSRQIREQILGAYRETQGRSGQSPTINN